MFCSSLPSHRSMGHWAASHATQYTSPFVSPSLSLHSDRGRYEELKATQKEAVGLFSDLMLMLLGNFILFFLPVKIRKLFFLLSYHDFYCGERKFYMFWVFVLFVSYLSIQQRPLPYFFVTSFGCHGLEDVTPASWLKRTANDFFYLLICFVYTLPCLCVLIYLRTLSHRVFLFVRILIVIWYHRIIRILFWYFSSERSKYCLLRSFALIYQGPYKRRSQLC